MSQATLLHRNLPIVEVTDPALLDELMLDRQVAEMVLARLSERVVAVDPVRVDALVMRLRKLGHLPRIEG